MARPKGSPKLGGRQKGTPNKVTVAMRKAILEAGITPLEYMLNVMRDPTADEKRRDAMAAQAAPYLHPKLQAITHSGDNENPVTVITRRIVGGEGD